MVTLEPRTPPEPLRRASRGERFRVDLLTPQDGTAGVLEGVQEVSVSSSADGTIHSVGSLNLDDVGQDIDWLTARCQPWLEVNGVEWPLGVFLMSAPETKYDGPWRSWDVSLRDKLAILDEDLVPETYTVPEGGNVVNAVRACIEESGERAYSVARSEQTLNHPMTWPVGTSRLRIVSDLLATINYSPLQCDGWGRYVSAPYTEPATRPVSVEFVEGENAIHLDTFTVNRDLAGVPNRLVCVASGGSRGLTLIAVSENHNPDSPFSIERRGRVITRVDNVDTSDVETLNAVAARRMIEAMDPAETVVFQHAWTPLSLDQVVRFKSSDVDVTGVVVKSDVTLEVGSTVTTSIRKVVAPNG